MQILKTITDSDFGLGFNKASITRERSASRGVVFDKDNNVAILDITNRHYHKLPGGGIDDGEDIIEALNRECEEEIGCAVEVTSEIGTIEEYRNRFGLHQLSYCFVAKVIGEKGLAHPEESEIADGCDIVWLSLDEAIGVLASELNVQDYEGKFIQVRDLFILQEAKKSLSLK
jgi:8-oxo-dGTP pyrophosphatase MutT (NUDIX family)